MANDKLDEHLANLAAMMPTLPHFAALGIKVLALTPGRCVMALDYADHLVGDPERGVLHGGVVTTLLDSAAGTAVFAQSSEDRPVTLDLRIDYLKPATPGARVYGEAQVVKRTRNISFVSGVAYQDDREAPVARCTASFMRSNASFPDPERQNAERQDVK